MAAMTMTWLDEWQSEHRKM